MLRMIISGTSKQHDQLIKVLETERIQGHLNFGIHRSSHALTTCIVQNYSRDHIHFLDGGNGGYAIAAKQLKQQGI